MNRRGFGFYSLVFGFLFLLSFSGAFAADEATKSADVAVPAASPANDTAVPVSTVSSADTAAVSDSQSASVLPADSVADEIPAETPVEADPLPSAPADAKLLYFYPEPEAPVSPKPVEASKKTVEVQPKSVPAPQKPAVVPEKKVAVPAESKPAASKSATEVKAMSSEKPGTAANKNAKAKTDDKAVAGDKGEKKAEEAPPGIWTAEPTAPAVQPASANNASGPSRAVSVAPGQTLEVWYPGAGWVYLGDATAQNGVSYQTRKLDKSDTLFTFRALKEGNYILEFSRYDVLANSFLSDSLAVSVTGSAVKRLDTVRAPDYRAASVASGTGSEGSAAASGTPVATAETGAVVNTAAQPAVAANPAGTGTAATASAIDTQAILEKVKAALAANDPASAQTLLDTFFAAAQEPLDEGLFLRGQAYEANGPARDMRKALSAYETLVATYPESSRWKEADARIRYIRQFYLTIR
jgi:hypothetical protein